VQNNAHLSVILAQGGLTVRLVATVYAQCVHVFVR